MFISDRFNVIMSQTGSNTYYLALEISNVGAADQAVYKVNARNSFGESNASIKLNFAPGKADHLYLLLYIITMYFLYHLVTFSSIVKTF